MDAKITNRISTNLSNGVRGFVRKLLFLVLTVGPIPKHVAFIPDGNRRYGRKWNLGQGEAHHTGCLNLLQMLRYCYEMGVQYVTFYAFSIDNFKRKQSEVQILMDMIKDKSQALIQHSSIANELGVRVEFFGNLEMLDASTKDAAEKAIAATVKNSRIVLMICLAYSSRDEIVRGIRGSCEETKAGLVSIEDLETNMYFAGRPDPDVLIRTSGETRLSNFLLWQTARCVLYAPRCLWPEMSLRHLVWGVVLYQRNWNYLERIKKKL